MWFRSKKSEDNTLIDTEYQLTDRDKLMLNAVRTDRNIDGLEATSSFLGQTYDVQDVLDKLSYMADENNRLKAEMDWNKLECANSAKIVWVHIADDVQLWGEGYKPQCKYFLSNTPHLYSKISKKLWLFEDVDCYEFSIPADEIISIGTIPLNKNNYMKYWKYLRR